MHLVGRCHIQLHLSPKAPLLRDFERVEIAVSVGEVTSQLAQLSVQPTLRQRIIVAQLNDPYLVDVAWQKQGKLRSSPYPLKVDLCIYASQRIM